MKFHVAILIVFSAVGLQALRENVALNKIAKQSSTYNYRVYFWPATLAVDGNRNQYPYNMAVGQCAHTLMNKAINWWAVDLGNEFDITDLKIYNRQDCCSDRLTNFFIYIYNPTLATWEGFDQEGVQLCYHYVDTAPSILNVACTSSIRGRYVKITYTVINYVDTAPSILNVACTSSIRGRYVKISKEHREHPKGNALNLCEVEIFIDNNPNEGSYCKKTNRQGFKSLDKNMNTVSLTECVLFCRRTESCLGLNMTTDGTCSLFGASKEVSNGASDTSYFERC
ncbi:fucolectin-1-like [Mytilus californianus]|uniref:fucolectin-1-like n=1 Tax=Mytilus californianus TaxID=6549 RepID=UPI00224799DC|nr:fucolectin-1-like [Mytilus californianus]